MSRSFGDIQYKHFDGSRVGTLAGTLEEELKVSRGSRSRGKKELKVSREREGGRRGMEELKVSRERVRGGDEG